MTVGFIGVGNMGGAIMKGAFQSGFIKPYETMVYDANAELLNAVKEKYAVTAADSNAHLASECDYIVIAVKPVYMRSVLDEIKKYVRNRHIISVAAGWSMDLLSDILGRDNGSQVMRVMPNTPALIRSGYTVICEENTFSKTALLWATNLFSALGVVQVLPERLFDAVVAVSGSSPAYVFMMIEAMADGAVKLGMPRQMAIQAAAQAVFGSAKMVLETGEHPAKLKDNVCSPGGTTIDAVAVLEKGGFRGTLIDAMDTCAQKSRRMTDAQATRRR